MTFDPEANTLSVVYDDGEYQFDGTMTKVVEEPVDPTPSEEGFVGTWQGSVGLNDTEIVLNEDGTGTYGGTEFTYTVEGNVITATNGVFTLTITFDPDANTLDVYYDDGDFTAEGTMERV